MIDLLVRRHDLSKRRAAKLADRLLLIVCHEWYTESNPQNLLKRYEYQAKKAEKATRP